MVRVVPEPGPDMQHSIHPLVFAGPVKPLPGDGRLSGINKHPLKGPWVITRIGIVGDAQADLKNHGGSEKALHHYPGEHYDVWAGEIGPHPLLAQLSAFGENLSTNGWTEADICIGDTLRFGGAVLQVSQGRQPCWKLNQRFGRKDMAYAVQKTGRTGWYYRVLQEGKADSGDPLILDHRPQVAWPLAHLIRLLYRDTMAKDELAAMAELPELAAGWRHLAQRRIETGKTENWAPGLGTLSVNT